jgi:hypothetical protein
MELRDLIVTPLLILFIYAIAYITRPWVTNTFTRPYFFPALTAKIVGALALGIIYQFYYAGGDTFNFHTHGSRHIWNAFMDSPAKGLTLLFSDGENMQGVYEYASKIYFLNDQSSYFVIRIAALFDLLTFSTYSATAVLFALISFGGGWAFFSYMCRIEPRLRGWIALAVLFIPSVVFWGSGLMKDTLTFASLGFLTYAVGNIYEKRNVLSSLLIMLVSVFVIFSIKKYILFCFLPAAMIWFYLLKVRSIRSQALKILIVPFFVTIVVAAAYYSLLLVGEGDARYSLGKIAETAKITAYDIRYYTGREAGSGYSLGELEGTFSSMLGLAPQAVNVSLFRPYVWEVRNPLMALSSVEGLLLLIFTIYVLIKKRAQLFNAFTEPVVLFCLVFSLTFAFAVGVSTYNFGTLSRYKIPLMPFYLLALVFILYYENKERKTAELERTE